MKTVFYFIILVLISITLLACSSTPNNDQQANTQDIAALPSFLTALDSTKLTATLKVYDAKTNLVLEQSLFIAENKVTSNPFVLEINEAYTFVIVFYYQIATENNLPIAYVLLSQTIGSQETEITFLEESYIYDDPNADNNINVDWNLNSYGIPDLDSDGDDIANLVEILQNTDPLVAENDDSAEEVVIVDGADDTEPTQRYYSDSDGDGYGVSSDFIDAIASTGIYTTTVSGDCNDNNSSIHPLAFEGCTNDGIDNDCDGSSANGFLCGNYSYANMLSMASLLRGNSSNDYLGGYVLPAGDVNGDGVVDILIGAHREDDTEDNEGAVYLYYGESDFDFGTATFTKFIGEANNDYLGIRISALGDLNKDGRDDVFMGAYRHDGNAISNTGASYVYYGETNWDAEIKLDSGDYTLKFIGEAAEDESTVNQHASGDVNGDGNLDLFISSAGRDDDGLTDNGAAYLYYGPFTQGTVNLSQTMPTRAKFIGPEDNSNFSFRASIDGDINADGHSDVLIAASLENANNQEDAGALYLFYGPISSGEHRTNEASVRFLGDNSGDNAGSDAAMNCDINNDGYQDILIGADNTDHDSGIDSGSAYLFFGPIGSPDEQIEINLSNADVIFFGEAPGDNAGNAVACNHDINDDGYDDILIGAPMETNGGKGKVYLIHGREANHFDPNTSLASADLSFIGNESGGYFGNTLSFAGDVNADGFEEILVSAYYEDNGAITNAGAAYLITIPE
ncbi:FG-GAP repeat protein [bacterium]|nr:FG-GAP repeat protein [bacterium]